jgi:hypothetical protein
LSIKEKFVKIIKIFLIRKVRSGPDSIRIQIRIRPGQKFRTRNTDLNMRSTNQMFLIVEETGVAGVKPAFAETTGLANLGQLAPR